MQIVVLAVFAAAVGAAVGSLLNVVIYRLPRGESLVHPASHCPGCEHAIRPYDNVPVLAWLWLRGRCRDCATKISARYPGVEALTAALAVAVVLTQSPARQVALGLVLVVVLVPVTLIDFDHQIIPNKITLPAALSALVIGAITGPAYLPTQLISGVAAAGFLLVFVLAYPRGMGMGDVKLAGVLGLFLGVSVSVAIMAGVLLGAIVGAGVMARVGVAQGRKTKLPFGPFLAAGGVIALFAGHAILQWYLHVGI
jgi:leader peptidase (prepilin peptidase) / N-methyltransferase